MLEVLETYYLLSHSSVREEKYKEKVKVETRRLSPPPSPIKSRMATTYEGNDLSLTLSEWTAWKRNLSSRLAAFLLVMVRYSWHCLPWTRDNFWWARWLDSNITIFQHCSLGISNFAASRPMYPWLNSKIPFLPDFVTQDNTLIYLITCCKIPRGKAAAIPVLPHYLYSTRGLFDVNSSIPDELNSNRKAYLNVCSLDSCA